MQLYFLRSKQGRDRPVFYVRRADRWFRCFCDPALEDGWLLRSPNFLVIYNSRRFCRGTVW